MKHFPILYKYTSKGQVQQWQIFVRDDEFYTVEGIKGGKLTTSLPTKCYSKNVGKKNETTPEAQAILEAKSRHQKKLDKGYNEKLSKKKLYFEPMLANNIKDKTISFRETRVFVQPKLDGLRCINRDSELRSRNGKIFTSCPHLHQAEVTLDGELYSHSFKDDFNKIVSLCKKKDSSINDLDEAARSVQQWVYDFPDHDAVFSERYNELKRWFIKNNAEERGFVLVPTYEVSSMEEIEVWHSKFISEGYEGTMIRLDIGPYENKRSDQLLKFKEFVDEEFKIIGYVEGQGGRTGTIGKFVLQHDKNPDQTFESNVKGNFDYLRKIWNERDTYIGRTATVKYFQRTPKTDKGGDVPRFPFIIKIDRESYE